jgi:hypothetical protein
MKKAFLIIDEELCTLPHKDPLTPSSSPSMQIIPAEARAQGDH